MLKRVCFCICIVFCLPRIAIADEAKILSEVLAGENLDFSAAFADVEKGIAQPDSNAADIEVVKDADIADWIDFELQVDLQESAKWQQLDGKARKTRIDEVRAHYIKSGRNIELLRNMTSLEREQTLFSAQIRYAKAQQLNSARLLMASLKSAQFRNIKISCERLLQQYPNVYRNIAVPEDLAFLDVDLLRIQGKTCVIFLQKDIGRGYGLEVNQTKQGLKLLRFDEFESWARTEIVD